RPVADVALIVEVADGQHAVADRKALRGMLAGDGGDHLPGGAEREIELRIAGEIGVDDAAEEHEERQQAPEQIRPERTRARPRHLEFHKSGYTKCTPRGRGCGDRAPRPT